MHKKFGIELEFSDIKTIDAAKLVYDYQKINIDDWQDIYNLKLGNKPKLKYDFWNVISDHTIKNSDGSVCMKTYKTEKNTFKKCSVFKGSKDRYKWQGVELISPVFSDLELFKKELKIYLDLLIKNNAVVKRNLDNALHVHIDISDLFFLEVKKIIPIIYKIQNSFIKFLTIDGLPIPLYTKDSVDKLISSKDEEEFWGIYRNMDGSILHPEASEHRRIIDVGPWFCESKNFKTIEFRAYSSSINIEYIVECVKLSLDTVDCLINNKDIKWIEKKTKYIESIYKDSTNCDTIYKLEETC